MKSDIKTTVSTAAVRPAANLANVVINKAVGHTTGNILYWDAVDGAKLYQVYRLDSGAWTLLKNTGSLAYKDETAPAGVKSYYKIVARNGEIKSDIAATASTGVVRPAAAVTKLDNVTITQIKPHSTGNILYWNAVENAKVYQVYRLENGSWVLLKNTGSLGYKDETAPVGVKCYYKIVARNGDVKSDIKTTASASATRP
jgi:fibronectin type 3 domain-containing protein